MGAATAAVWKSMLRQRHRQRWQICFNSGNNASAEDVYKLALGGNDRARQLLRVHGPGPRRSRLANLINIFNFPLYLLSGGALAAWDLFDAEYDG